MINLAKNSSIILYKGNRDILQSEIKNLLFRNSLFKFSVEGNKVTANKKTPIDSKPPTQETKIEPFIPSNEQTFKDIKSKYADYKREVFYYFGAEKYKLSSKSTNMTEFLAKKLRHSYMVHGLH